MKQTFFETLLWPAAGALFAVLFPALWNPAFHSLVLLCSTAFCVSALVLLASNSNTGQIVRLLLFVAGGALCFMINTGFPLSALQRDGLLFFFMALFASLPLFKILAGRSIRHAALRPLACLLWMLFCLGEPRQSAVFCLLLSAVVVLALNLKAAGANPLSSSYWQKRQAKKVEAERIEARNRLLTSMMIHNVESSALLQKAASAANAAGSRKSLA